MSDHHGFSFYNYFRHSSIDINLVILILIFFLLKNNFTKGNKKYAANFNTGELSDRIVDNFIKKIQEQEESKPVEENNRVPLSECNGTIMNSSNYNQEKDNASEVIK